MWVTFDVINPHTRPILNVKHTQSQRESFEAFSLAHHGVIPVSVIIFRVTSRGPASFIV